MRYEDWDVLLFPGGDQGHVPIKEFRTACCGMQDEVLARSPITRENSSIPLMTCFVPSLPEGAAFQISVHCWSPQDFIFRPNNKANGDAPPQMWQVKVTVDEICTCIETFPPDVTWPKVISIANLQEPHGDHLPPLRFPRFHRSVMSQNHWDASDEIGRVKIEISEGYADTDQGKTTFVKLANHAHFNFQPAPLDILNRAGIAWPNFLMFKDLPLPVSLQNGDGNAKRSSVVHRRQASTASMGNVSSSRAVSSPLAGPGGLPAPPPPTPTGLYNQHLQPPQDPNYATSSRSTSAYSTVPISALPLSAAAAINAIAAASSPAYPEKSADGHREVRLSSDQLQKILDALSVPNVGDVSEATSMPPPPLPQHAVDRRAVNSSDISMHASCTDFPTCTSEDGEGRVVHNPGSMVRGRKEGSKDISNRDFLSKVLNPTAAKSAVRTTESDSPEKVNSLLSSSPAGSSTKKRTRSTLKSLSVNEGSPEKLADKDVSKPVRKVSRASATSDSDKENVYHDDGAMLVDT